MQVGVFPEFSGEEYENFTKLAEKLRNAYDFGHTLDAKILPRGDLSVKGPLIILFKPFDDLFADFKVLRSLRSIQFFLKTSPYINASYEKIVEHNCYIFDIVQDFDITAMEKFIVKEDDPSVTVFNMDDPGNPYISRFFSDRNLNTKVNKASNLLHTISLQYFNVVVTLIVKI